MWSPEGLGQLFEVTPRLNPQTIIKFVQFDLKDILRSITILLPYLSIFNSTIFTEHLLGNIGVYGNFHPQRALSVNLWGLLNIYGINVIIIFNET